MEQCIDANYESTEAQEFQRHVSADLMQNAGPSAGLKDSEFTETQGATVPPSNESEVEKPVDLTSLGEFTYYGALPANYVARPREEIPSDFLEPTPDDLKAAQASLISRSKAYQDAPLLTENLRNRRAQEFRSKMPKATIRIKFADRSMLEKTFDSESRIKPVYAFVRACLREDAKQHKFVLFETPPVRELKVSDQKVKDLSLFDLHLAPRSVLHFRFVEDEVMLDTREGPPPLLPAILSQAVDLPVPPSQERESPAVSRPLQSAASNTALPSPQTEKEKKIARLMKFAKGKK